MLTVAAPAWAEGDELEMPVPVKVAATQSAPADAAPAAEPTARPKKKSQSAYKDVLGSLPIARDFAMPGAVMSVRLLPTSRALSGEPSTPIVLRPRVPGGGGWYGVDIAARF